MLIYFLIFFSKIIENTLSTLRLIVVANGKKKMGALLQGLVALVWIFVTGIVIIDINKDIFKIVFFVLGSMAGSYFGSILEEKIALGSLVLMCITDKMHESIIKDKLSNYKIISLSENDIVVLHIFIKRKEVNKTKEIISNIDKNAIIISEKVKPLSNIV